MSQEREDAPKGGSADGQEDAAGTRQEAELPRPFSRLGEDYLVYRRDENETWKSAETSEILLSGNLVHIEVADLINFLTMSRLTGILQLVDGEIEKSLHFHRGELVFAHSSDKDDRIGEVLVRLGKINQRQLEAVSIKFPGKMKIGRFMVQQELISPQVLWEGIRQQVREIFFGFLEQNQGVFFFLDAQPSAGRELNLSLTTHNLLLEGVQRKDELAHYRKRIPNDEMIFSKRHPLPTKELTSNERRILRLVDGNSNVSELAMLSQLERFSTLKTLFHLLQAGFVEILLEGPAPQEAPLEAPAMQAEGGRDAEERPLRDVISVFNEIFMEILQALRRHLPDAGALKILNSFFQNLEPHLARLFRGLKLRENGALDAETLLKNLDAAGAADPRSMLTDGLKELFFFCVFEATSRLEPEEEEFLMERIQKLQNNLRA
jgi:hypothetical protein